jgi:hypothetical protein
MEHRTKYEKGKKKIAHSVMAAKVKLPTSNEWERERERENERPTKKFQANKIWTYCM